MKPTDVTTMTRYLLGQLPEAERDACEQKWFTDKAQYVQLCEAENALIDDYVRGTLRGAERALFEQHFLAIPARRERVMTARALVQVIDQPIVPAEGSWQSWWAGWRMPQLLPALAMALLLLFGGLWLYARQERLAQTATIAAEQQRHAQELEQSLAAERAANARLTEELARHSDAPPPVASVPKTLLFTLTAGVLRSDGGEALPTLRLAKDVERVQLQVMLPAHEYKKITATLRTATGRDVQRWTVNATGTRLSLSLSAKQLKAGDYLLVVNGHNAQREVEEFRRLPLRVSQP